MKLIKIQRILESIYRIDQTPNVDEFLFSTDSTKEFLEMENDPKPQVLLCQEGDEVFFGVHIGDERLIQLEEKDLDQIALCDFLSIAEELSHFVYLSWSAQNHSPVSLLNIELQGEIDKYLLSELFRSEETKDLLDSLFENFRVHEELEEDERIRYEEANRLGRKVCQGVLGSQAGFTLEKSHLQWLREFYRLASQRRLSTAASL